MKVLVLGLPRTGTQSIADALVELGIGPVYHMREVGKNNHQAMWLAAIESKFEGRGKPWGREEFERILSGYEAVADFPAAIFPGELIAAYPEATVVLSTRDPSSWHASMSSTLWHHHSHRPADDPSPLAPLARKYHAHCWGNDFPANGLAFFHKHEALVREETGREPGGLLEFRPSDGWVPLCTFLGAEVPEAPFPRNDDWAEYKKKVNGEAGGVEEA